MYPPKTDDQRNTATIADHLGDITASLTQAVATGDFDAIAKGIAQLGQLRMSVTQTANHPLHAQ